MTPLDPKVPGNKIFVAATALEEFWDTSYPVVFLSEACKRYGRRAFWSGLKGEALELGAEDKNAFETIEYLKQVSERLLPLLAETLNGVHKTGFSKRFWRIAIGPWLLYYLHGLHDKYHRITRVRRQYPDFTSICLDESCFVTPQNTFDFMGYIKGDAYNLQIVSRLFDALGYKFPKRKIEVKIDAAVPGLFALLRRSARGALERAFAALMRLSRNGNKVFFAGAYFSGSAAARLMLKTGGGFWPLSCGFETPESREMNGGARDLIGAVKFGDTEFEKLLMPLIARDLPMSMLESFGEIRKTAAKKFIRGPKAIMSAISWHLNDTFKIYAAESAEQGTVLLGVQHGGNYGSMKYLFQESYELSVVDRYYSWGWSESRSGAAVKPMPGSKFAYTKKADANKSLRDILYVTATWFRWPIQYPVTAEFWTDYFREQALFLSGLPPAARKHLVIRPHIEDFGCDVRRRFADAAPDVRVETWKTPFRERLSASRIFVCDHPCYSTTLIEALINNKPTILFYDPRFSANCFNEGAKPYWDKLKEAGILFEEPAAASKKLAEIYEHAGDWWGEKGRQEAVKLFLSRFGRTSENWVNEWSSEINSILGK